MKRKIAFIICIFGFLGLNAQYEQHGVGISRDFINGTARYISMGGAFNSLGGDFSSIINNPAGLGVYRSSELSFSEDIITLNSTTSYLGKNSVGRDYRFDMSELGFVTNYELSDNITSGLKYLNFSFGYNKLADFNNYITAESDLYGKSITDYFASSANGLDYNQLGYEYNGDDIVYNPFEDGSAPFESILAWNTFLIDTIPGSTNTYWGPLYKDDLVKQYYSKNTKGEKGEYNFSFATNYNDVLFLGLSVGVQRTFFDEYSVYSEVADLGNTSILNSLDYTRHFSYTGTGANAKFGLIYKPSNWVRVAAAIQSPTFYRFLYSYHYKMEAEYITDYLDSEFGSSYNFNYVSPMKANFGASFIYKKLALLSIDYELIDYRSISLSDGPGTEYTEMNNYYNNNLKMSHNLRAGTEINLGIFSVRGGYAYSGSPYIENELNDYMQMISGGIGVKYNSFKFDVAYSVSNNSYYGRTYYTNPSNIDEFRYDVKSNDSRLIFTFGYRF